MKNLQISVNEIKGLGKVSKGLEPFFCEGIDDAVKGQELEVSFSLIDCENEILLEGEIGGKLKLECSLCLEEVWFPVKIKICASYPATQEFIDVADEVKQLVVLNLPLKTVCNDDCKGICAVCGKNKNVADCGCSQENTDPRWGKLKQILNK